LIIKHLFKLYTDEKIRDEFMAQNVIWLYNHMRKSKMIIWAHNGHISKGERCGFAKIICEEAMGNFLKKEYGDDYLPVGFVFNQGCFNAFSKEKVFRTFCVDEAPSGTSPYLLSRSQSDNCFIDFNQIKDTRFVKEFLMKPLKNQSVGTYFVAKDRFGKIKLKDKYEALIFVDKSTKPVYLE